MLIGRLPVDEQLRALRATLARNEPLMEVLFRAAKLDLPGWYLTAGCVFQTVWNVVTDRPPTDGIKDYDLFYFDDSDLSWDAENKAIEAGAAAFGDLPVVVEIRNEARVHLWYEDHFGVPCAPYTSTEAAIDSFAATTCCLGVRLSGGDQWRIYAPHGLADVFNLVVRPNPVLAPRSVYETKTRRWLEHWPELTVLPWPETAQSRSKADPDDDCGVPGCPSAPAASHKNRMVAAVRELVEDWSAGPPANWDNHSLRDYLAALAGWLDDCEGYYANRGVAIPWNGWEVMQAAMRAATVYE